MRLKRKFFFFIGIKISLLRIRFCDILIHGSAEEASSSSASPRLNLLIKFEKKNETNVKHSDSKMEEFVSRKGLHVEKYLD